MVTYRNARPGETLFGGGSGILIPFRPIENGNTAQPSETEIDEEASSDRGYYTDIGEIESTIQDFVDTEEDRLGRPLTKKEHQAIVKLLTPEEQEDYEEEVPSEY
jgi:hypothetical protein